MYIPKNMTNMTDKHLSKCKTFDEGDVVDDVFDEFYERTTDDKIKMEKDALMAEDDIFDETLERKIKADVSIVDIKPYYINRHGEREYLFSETKDGIKDIIVVEEEQNVIAEYGCFETIKSENKDIIVIEENNVIAEHGSSDRVKSEIKNIIIIEEGEESVIAGTQMEAKNSNSFDTNKAGNGNLLEIGRKHGEICQEEIKSEPLNYSNSKSSINLEYSCSKCPFNESTAAVFKKHLLSHEDNNSDSVKSSQIDTFTNLNDKSRDKLSKTQYSELETRSLVVNIDILNKNINHDDSTLTRRKRKDQIGSDKIMVDGTNSVDIFVKKSDTECNQIKSTSDQLINGKLKENCSSKKLWNNKLVGNNKMSEPNNHYRLRKINKYGKRGKHAAHIEKEEINKSQMKITCVTQQKTENKNIGTSSIYESQNAELRENTKNLLWNNENERLAETINEIKNIIHKQDSYKLNVITENGNNKINKDKNNVTGFCKEGINYANKNADTFSCSKEYEILTATLSQIKNIIYKKDKTSLSASKLPLEAVNSVINANETDQSGTSDKCAKYTSINPEYSCTKCTFNAKRGAVLKSHLLKHGIEVDILNTNNVLKIKESLSEKDTVDTEIEINEEDINKNVGKDNILTSGEEQPVGESVICRKRRLTDYSKEKCGKVNRKKTSEKKEILEDLKTVVYSCTICSFVAKRKSIVTRHLLKHDVECLSSVTSKVDFLKVADLPEDLKKEGALKHGIANDLPIQERYTNSMSITYPEKKTKTRKRRSDNVCKGIHDAKCLSSITSKIDFIKVAELPKDHKKECALKQGIANDLPIQERSTDNTSIVYPEKQTKTKKRRSDITARNGNHDVELVSPVTSKVDFVKVTELPKEHEREKSEVKYSRHSSLTEFEKFFQENFEYYKIFITNDKENYDCANYDGTIYDDVEKSIVVSKDEDPEEKLTKQEEVKPVTVEHIVSESINKMEISASIHPVKKARGSEGENIKLLYSCDECSYQSHNKKYFRNHRYIHSKTILKCNLCSYVTNIQRNLNIHNLTHVNPKERVLFKCEHCPYSAMTRGSLKSHMVLHLEDAPIYQCDQCIYQSKKKSNLRHHKLRHKSTNELQSFKCALCSFKTKRKVSIKAHMIVHQKPENIYWYKCDKCPHTSKFKSALRKHNLIHRPPEEVNIFTCIICKYSTKYKNHLIEHMVLHKDPSEVCMYQCEHCSYKTIKKCNLHSHMLHHKTIEELDMKKCTHCSYITKLMGNLRKHIQRKHGSCYK